MLDTAYFMAPFVGTLQIHLSLRAQSIGGTARSTQSNNALALCMLYVFLQFFVFSVIMAVNY